MKSPSIKVELGLQIEALSNATAPILADEEAQSRRVYNYTSMVTLRLIIDTTLIQRPTPLQEVRFGANPIFVRARPLEVLASTGL